MSTCAGRGSDDPAEKIRCLYLDPKASYSIEELARLWMVTVEDVCDMVTDVLGSSSNDDTSFHVSWDHAVRVARTFHVFRPIDAETALGDDFDRMYGEHWRTVPILIHLPRWVVDSILRTPFTPASESVAALAERLLCDTVEAEEALRTISRAAR